MKHIKSTKATKSQESFDTTSDNASLNCQEFNQYFDRAIVAEYENDAIMVDYNTGVMYYVSNYDKRGQFVVPIYNRDGTLRNFYEVYD